MINWLPSPPSLPPLLSFSFSFPFSFSVPPLFFFFLLGSQVSWEWSRATNSPRSMAILNCEVHQPWRAFGPLQVFDISASLGLFPLRSNFVMWVIESRKGKGTGMTVLETPKEKIKKK